ncbi:MAG: hypothetical protein NTX72_00440 [Candidatus Uhrbacteria bacterium]|nr:hypothetical protein [Candidatus Uhrbacteria bacterium]
MASKRGLRIRAAKIAAREKGMVIVLRPKWREDTEPFCKCEHRNCLCSDGGCAVCDTKIKVGEFSYSNYDSKEVRRQNVAAMIPSYNC